MFEGFAAGGGGGGVGWAAYRDAGNRGAERKEDSSWLTRAAFGLEPMTW